MRRKDFSGSTLRSHILRCVMFGAAIMSAAGSVQLAAQDHAQPLSFVPVPEPAPTPLQPAVSGSFTDAMAAIRSQQWDRARREIAAMRDPDLANFVRSELFLAANSPRADGSDLLALLQAAPTLPQAQQLARLAQRRGVTSLPALPTEQRLSWAGSSPRRGNPASVSDAALGGLPRQINERIVADDPTGAEALLAGAEARLGSDALTEWRYRIAWSYYIENDDINARRMATLAQGGTGLWLAQADWAQGLASWRAGDCAAAMSGFRNVAGRARDAELEAAGHFWFARAATACAEPHEAQPALRRAAQLVETFYGQLAAETLGLPRSRAADPDAATSRRVETLPNVRAAMQLVALDERQLADQTLRHQARIGAPGDHEAILAIAARLNLPETQFYLAHNSPGGRRLGMHTRFPAPQWAPSTGWRIDPALIFAHTLQESQFRATVVSPAGAVGLMQVRPGTANDMGLASMGGRLTNPQTNLALGQSYIEYLRDSAITGGLLPKVIAAYNAGPGPVARWNSEIRDNGDPLLYIESIPYWETRGYVGTVLRNLWIYEQQMGSRTDTRTMLAQGRWPRVPTAPADLARASGWGRNAGGN